MIQFFTMHEILHTYRFWVFDEKTPSLLFMLREEKFSFIATIPIVFWWRTSKLRENIFRSYIPKINIVSPCDLACFPFFKAFFRRSLLCPLLVAYAAWCMMLMLCEMMWWCYVMQNDDYSEDTGTSCDKSHNLFESVLTFCYKPPLGASSPFTSAESALTFRCKLCIPLGTTLELLRLYFSALDGALSAFTFTFLGGFCSYRTKKGNYMWWPH